MSDAPAMEMIKALDDAPHWRKRASLRKEWLDTGAYTGRTLPELIALCVAEHPDIAVIFGSRENPCETTVGELYRESEVIASGLAGFGLKEGDVVVVQIPNWKESALTLLAALRLGLIYVPVIHTYETAELSFVLKATGAKALILPSRWRKIDFCARLAGLASLPELKNIITIGDDELPAATARWNDLSRAAIIPLPRLQSGPDDPWMINFTSGTTASPKGVVHTHHSFASEVRSFPMVRSSSGRPAFMPLPGGHVAGVIFMLRSFLASDPGVMMDVFDEDLAIELIRKHRCDRAGGVPFMLSIYLGHSNDLFPDGVLQIAVGATGVPPTLIRRCEDAGWPSTRTYGSTEHPTICGSWPDDPFEKRATSDGQLLAGVQVRLVDDDGVEAPRGEPGEIVSMGPELFKGYIDPAHNATAFTDDGWFRTGDIGAFDEDGYLRIVDRKKDIIIRGGENISSKEVEDALMRHDSIIEAAVVGWPDQRLGEKVGAFIRLRPEAADLSSDQLRRHFMDAGLSIQKTPEYIVFVDDFPRTPSGKIMKGELRSRTRAMEEKT